MAQDPAGPQQSNVHQKPWCGQYFGEFAGDHTIPIASQIPDEVVNEIRKNDGGLRLKFRLKPGGFFWAETTSASNT
jgi:hypothetical protein